MPEDVIRESSTEQEQGVTGSDTQPQGAFEQEQNTSATPTGEGQSPQADVDDLGVPYKNRYHEYKRKYEDLTGKYEEIITRLDNLPQTAQKQRQASEAEYLAYANDPNTSPEHRMWAMSEIEKLREEKTAGAVRRELEQFQKKQQDTQVRNSSTQYAINQYPEIAFRDSAGNFAGFNMESPMMRKIDELMRQEPELRTHPKGFALAADVAYAQLARSRQTQTAAKQEKLKQENTQLKKQTLVEGGGKPVVPQANPIQSAIGKTQSGSVKDAAAAMKEIFKARGVIEE